MEQIEKPLIAPSTKISARDDRKSETDLRRWLNSGRKTGDWHQQEEKQDHLEQSGTLYDIYELTANTEYSLLFLLSMCYKR